MIGQVEPEKMHEKSVKPIKSENKNGGEGGEKIKILAISIFTLGTTKINEINLILKHSLLTLKTLVYVARFFW